MHYWWQKQNTIYSTHEQLAMHYWVIYLIRYHFSLFTANKETAFVHSISAAGVTYKLTHDCRTGKFKDCDCIQKKSKKDWGGCNDNVRFGDILARHFLDALEKQNKARSAMNLHNNEVGRKVTITFLLWRYARLVEARMSSSSKICVCGFGILSGYPSIFVLCCNWWCLFAY